ncbi:MAG TPA: GNAT family N-acetyltransferase [Candidatus Acidoferrum sp.]|nr:GNAT family N-acetyltransferase [Candidatus Acidoferrum sp.]
MDVFVNSLIDLAAGWSMEQNLDDVAVVNNEEARRFEANVNGLRAMLTYRQFPDRIIFDHTEVPPPLERKGLAANLTRAALDFARAHHLRVVPECSYVASYIRRHPEVQDLVSPHDLQRILSRSSTAPGS